MSVLLFRQTSNRPLSMSCRRWFRYNPPGEKAGAVFAVDVTMDSTYVVTANADGVFPRNSHCVFAVAYELPLAPLSFVPCCAGKLQESCASTPSRQLGVQHGIAIGSRVMRHAPPAGGARLCHQPWWRLEVRRMEPATSLQHANENPGPVLVQSVRPCRRSNLKRKEAGRSKHGVHVQCHLDLRDFRRACRAVSVRTSGSFLTDASLSLRGQIQESIRRPGSKQDYDLVLRSSSANPVHR